MLVRLYILFLLTEKKKSSNHLFTQTEIITCIFQQPFNALSVLITPEFWHLSEIISLSFTFHPKFETFFSTGVKKLWKKLFPCVHILWIVSTSILRMTSFISRKSFQKHKSKDMFLYYILEGGGIFMKLFLYLLFFPSQNKAFLHCHN